MAADPRTSEEKAKQNAIVAQVVKGVGAIFMLAAPLVAFDIFGLAGLIGIADGFLQYIMGGVMLVIGLIDFFVIAPTLLRAGAAPKDRDEAL